MHFSQIRSRVRLFAAGALIAGLTLTPGGARADSDLGMQILSYIGIGVGGYSFTGNAENALGSPKFVGHTTVYVKPAHRRGYEVTAGYQEVSIRDHWHPFSGGNRVTLQGAAFKISPEKHDRYQLVPFVNGGLFYGVIHSDKMNFRANGIVPSLAVGLQKEVARYVRLSAGFRLTGRIGGVDTSGGYVSLTLFP